MKELEELKLSLRIETDDDTDDSILTRCIEASKSYLKSAIGSESIEGMEKFYSLPDITSRFNVAMIALASTYYMYRVSVQVSAVNEVNPIAKAIIGQLRIEYEMERAKYEKSKSEQTDSSNQAWNNAICPNTIRD